MAVRWQRAPRLYICFTTRELWDNRTEETKVTPPFVPNLSDWRGFGPVPDVETAYTGDVTEVQIWVRDLVTAVNLFVFHVRICQRSYNNVRTPLNPKFKRKQEKSRKLGLLISWIHTFRDTPEQSTLKLNPTENPIGISKENNSRFRLSLNTSTKYPYFFQPEILIHYHR